jgi:methylase of polypeptide subunit release factors
VVTSEEALDELLRYLKAADYQFKAVTPATHAIVLARPANRPLSLRDIFGWNRPFEEADISPKLLSLLRDARMLDQQDGMLRSNIRVASLDDDLLLHSAFPTDDKASVFFGPDTYRFIRFLRQHLPRHDRRGWLIDMGAGSGAGAIAAARARAWSRVTLVDSNPAALDLAAVNARVAGIEVETLSSEALPEGADLVIGNPPYLMDPAGRSYRDGGELWGGAVALDWVSQGLRTLAPNGLILLYTGVAYVNGEAPLLGRLEMACSTGSAAFAYEEIDPDVFGDELARKPYQSVERIAAVGIVIRCGSRGA